MTDRFTIEFIKTLSVLLKYVAQFKKVFLKILLLNGTVPKSSGL